jgi:sulfoxide reductase heme-binding subunit YedZ
MRPPRRTAASISVSLVALGAALITGYVAFEPYAPVRALRLARASGWLAGVLLAFALCVTPLARGLDRLGYTRPVWLIATRRSLGLAATSCGLAHAVYALLALPGVAALVLSTAWMRAGLLTLAILLALFATSFDGVLRRVRLQHWKELHRLVYPAALTLALHVLLGPFGSPALELTFVALLVCVIASRFLFSRKPIAMRSDE